MDNQNKFKRESIKITKPWPLLFKQQQTESGESVGNELKGILPMCDD